MKLIFALIPACTYATFMQMAADYLKLQGMEENRGLTEVIGLEAFTVIDGYGCWCYFEDDHGLGRSQPQDAIDAHCRTIHDGYTCAIKDHGSTCVPWEIDYNSGVTGDLSQLQDTCDANNANDECAADACKVEGLFVYELFQLTVNGVDANPAKFGVANGWDREEECPVAPGQIERPDFVDQIQCCGDQPYRHPFHTRGGLNECCGITLMNSVQQECCSGNPDSPAPIGFC